MREQSRIGISDRLCALAARYRRCFVSVPCRYLHETSLSIFHTQSERVNETKRKKKKKREKGEKEKFSRGTKFKIPKKLSRTSDKV